MKFLSLLGLALSIALAPQISAQPVASPPPAWENDRITPVVRSASNRAVGLTILNMTRTSHYGKIKAPGGREFLLLATEWTNHIELTSVKGKNVATAYSVKDLRDNAYLVGDGQTLWQISPQSDYVPGVLSRRPFTVERPGESVKGNLVFDVPAGAAPTSLTFRFYDFAHGHMTVELAGPPPAPGAAVQSQKNEVIEVGVHGMRTVDRLNDSQAPAGLVYLVIDLRARSTVSTDADAKAFDPHAEPGAKIRVGTVADWKESRKYLQVIVDGEYAWPAVSQTELPAEPRFLPDVFTGGKAVFLVPEKHASLELRCEFPNAKLTDGKLIRPAGLTTILVGKRPELAERKSIARVKDTFFDVSVVEQIVASEFAGTRAAAGKRFLILDVTVKNLSQQQEFFQTIEQLKHLDERGAASAAEKVTFAGLRRPLELIYIPSGEQRSFQLVYQVAAAETKPRLGYTSATQGGSKAISLAVIDAAPLPEAVIPGPPQLPSTVPNSPRVAPANVRAPPVAARQDHKPRGLEGVGLTRDQVNLAIDRGAEGLWEVIRAQDLKTKGSKFGGKSEHILAALALVHAGAHKKIPDFDTALRAYLKDVQPRKLRTYETGLLAMLLEAYGEPEFLDKMEEAARHLLESQGAKGTWAYMAFLPDEIYKRVDLSKTALPGIARLAADKKPLMLERRSRQRPDADGDNSNTQYAILGLNAASRTGIKISPDVWRLILQTTFERQEATGGWSYRDKGGSAYGSMTAAGICAVALCRHELGEADPLKDQAIEAGLGWLVANFSITTHPKTTTWLYYYIYSIERLGQILNTEFIGPNEWYPMGANFLLAQQKPTGLWIGNAQEIDPRLASSFALLFLTRATPTLNPKPDLRPATSPIVKVVPPTPPPVQVAKPKTGMLRTAVLPPFHNIYIILDASASMQEKLDGKDKLDIARDSIHALVNHLPAKTNVALRVYGHRKPAITELDTELVVPSAPLDRKKFNAVLDGLEPGGKRALALSLEEAAKDLAKAKPEDPTLLLLLTTGGDETDPRRDPLKSAELLSSVNGIRFNIAGLAIDKPEWTQQLSALAQQVNGRYWPAPRAVDLQPCIHTSVLGWPEKFVVLDAKGHEALSAPFGEPATLPEGKYRLQARSTAISVEREFSIKAGSITSITFDAPQALVITSDGAIPAAAVPPK